MTHIIDAGGENDKYAIPLGTLRTSHVRNEKRLEWTKDRLQETLNTCKSVFPDLEVRSITATYNCVGMVFASRRVWVDPDEVNLFLTDDNYAKLDNLDHAQIGDVAIYKSPEGSIKHVGIIIERKVDIKAAQIQFKILSKWSVNPEFIHRPSEVFASYGQLSEIWTDRKEL